MTWEKYDKPKNRSGKKCETPQALVILNGGNAKSYTSILFNAAATARCAVGKTYSAYRNQIRIAFKQEDGADYKAIRVGAYASRIACSALVRECGYKAGDRFTVSEEDGYLVLTPIAQEVAA